MKLFHRATRGLLGSLGLAASSLLLYGPEDSQVQGHRSGGEVRVDVRSLGAKGDGVADDTAALRRAIAAIPATGGTVYLPCGTYVVTSGLTVVTSHTTVMSEDNCATLKLAGSNGFVALSVRGRGLTKSTPLMTDTTDGTFTVGRGELRALGIAAGSYAIVSDQEVASNGPNSPPISTQQVVKIVSVEGDTATIEGGFAHHFTLATPYPDNQGCCPYVQRIMEPVEGVRILRLGFDGSANTGSATGAIRFYYAVDSEIGFVTVSDFVQKPGPTEAFLIDTGYGNHFHHIACTSCGNGMNADGHSMAIRRQTRATMNDIGIRNTAAQYTFSFNLASVNYSSATKVLIDGGGSDGRPFKLLRANHNTFAEVTAKNGGHGKNGFSITDVSTFNIFRDCTAIGNNGTGIMMFGNFNSHNMFVNSLAENNTISQFGQGHDAFGNYGDNFTTIKGGTFCCARGRSNIIQINSDDFTMSNATVYDDQGRAPNGVVIRGARPVLQDNKFSGLEFRHDVVYSKE